MNRACRGALVRSALVSLLLLCNAGCGSSQVPESWRHLAKTDGQAYPVPAAWLSTPEGAIAHGLKLPGSIPKPVPFDFRHAQISSIVPGAPSVAQQYFSHLCGTEAGEWVLRRIPDVEGLYFARPEGSADVTDQYLADLYAPEAPWIERHFQLMGETAADRGGQFVWPPFRNYRFVEEPRRHVGWQSDVAEPYIRMFGYSATYTLHPHPEYNLGLYQNVEMATPMQMTGVSAPSARYGLTWRGIVRPRDREFGIAGGELIIYDLRTREVIAVSRTFQLTRPNPRRSGAATWLVSPTCRQGIADMKGLGISDFARRVLIELKAAGSS